MDCLSSWTWTTIKVSQTPNSGEITKTFTARSLGRGYGKVVSSVGGMSASHMHRVQRVVLTSYTVNTVCFSVNKLILCFARVMC